MEQQATFFILEADDEFQHIRSVSLDAIVNCTLRLH